MATKTKPDRFAEMCAEFPLRPIRTDEQLEAATAVAHVILRKPRTTQDEEDYLESLSLLIHEYEEARYPEEEADVSGADMLRFMIETNNLTQAEVSKATKIPVSSISEMVTGKRGIGAKHAAAFGAYFNMSPAAFLPKAGKKAEPTDG